MTDAKTVPVPLTRGMSEEDLKKGFEKYLEEEGGAEARDACNNFKSYLNRVSNATVHNATPMADGENSMRYTPFRDFGCDDGDKTKSSPRPDLLMTHGEETGQPALTPDPSESPEPNPNAKAEFKNFKTFLKRVSTVDRYADEQAAEETTPETEETEQPSEAAHSSEPNDANERCSGFKAYLSRLKSAPTIDRHRAESNADASEIIPEGETVEHDRPSMSRRTSLASKDGFRHFKKYLKRLSTVDRLSAVGQPVPLEELDSTSDEANEQPATSSGPELAEEQFVESAPKELPTILNRQTSDGSVLYLTAEEAMYQKFMRLYSQ